MRLPCSNEGSGARSNVCFCCERFNKKGLAGRPQPARVITDAPPNPIRTAFISSKRRYSAPRAWRTFVAIGAALCDGKTLAERALLRSSTSAPQLYRDHAVAERADGDEPAGECVGPRRECESEEKEHRVEYYPPVAITSACAVDAPTNATAQAAALLCCRVLRGW